MGCGSSTPEEKVSKQSIETAPKAEQLKPAPAQNQPKKEDSTPKPAPPPPANPQPEPPKQAAPTPQPEPKPEPTPAPPPKPQQEKIVTKGVKDDSGDAYGLLLCGAGESGKTTFTRQLRIKYLDEFTSSERQNFVATMRGNMIEAMQTLLVWLERQRLELENEDLQDLAYEISQMDAFSCEFTEEIAEQLKELWQDGSIQEAFSHKDETIIPDHMDYFFNKIDKIVQEDFQPSDEDILKARIRTIGIDKVTINCDDALIRIYDVGGQKSERSKWEKCMSEVQGVIFCVSFAEFDKPMFESPEIPRIQDALSIFEQVTHKEKFQNAPFFVLCNKYDAFSDRIKNTDAFSKTFPQYQGNPHDPDECAKFMTELFLEKARPDVATRPINTYKLIALDSDNVVQTTNQICKYIREHYFE
ncbi:transducin alpha subunit, putative [Trichomonas vaginalis G3]|uniref:Transducin alpha subunit, putative n=1 Tax=Trichomonas vaginalis (strain ATCC PRA-98 / G3) TaxID=412133 RepID=A2E157_TRIV3|nr:G-protein beta/gamma-subunit complex binding [Trichomonas vaginalis G3]EAY13558.1 transducin alpha subunit, putative [Trichomonas vaginalis G3]KAI5486387.1 G-protein beta/gamma-subunit complex binding [Trichomonas vaginalis G3]|eukprot:XP_001325781.1 transducin alpha subunit [Trichomonas vaginalis G3]